MKYLTVSDIREEFARMRTQSCDAGRGITHGQNGTSSTLEIVGASFLADSRTIFGIPNEAYIKHELDWYKSMSCNVNDIPCGPPKIWTQVATPDGRINSNYGYLIWSDANHSQYDTVKKTLAQSYSQGFSTRQAVMIYTRPSIHTDSTKDGMKDFICTNAVQYIPKVDIQTLDCIVQMRSNDAIFGYRNDYAWQVYVLDQLIRDLRSEYSLDLRRGKIIWQVGSLHVYSSHFHLIDTYIANGEVFSNIKKS